LSQPIVFDSSALVELFDAHAIALSYWNRADQGSLTVVFPASAIAEANLSLRAEYNAWSALLWPESVNVAPLDASSAIEVGLQHHDGLVTSHVAHEARAVRGIVLTSEPKRYSGAAVPLLVL
jgi:hypothetical protein